MTANSKPTATRRSQASQSTLLSSSTHDRRPQEVLELNAMYYRQRRSSLKTSPRGQTSLSFFSFFQICESPHSHRTKHKWTHTHKTKQSSEDTLQWLVLSFYRVSPRDRTQINRFGSKHLYALNHFAHPLRSLLLSKEHSKVADIPAAKGRKQKGHITYKLESSQKI